MRLGRIRRAHGIRGQLRAEYFGEDPGLLSRLTETFLEPPDGSGAFPVKVLKANISAPGVLLTLEGTADRTAAEALQGFFVSVPRSALPPPAEDELYQADLLGLPVSLSDGRLLGEAIGFADFGGTQLLEVKAPDGATLLIPWTDEYIREASPEDGRVVVEDAPGLLDQGR